MLKELELLYKKYIIYQNNENKIIDSEKIFEKFKDDLLNNHELIKSILGKEEAKQIYDLFDHDPNQLNFKYKKTFEEKLNNIDTSELKNNLPYFSKKDFFNLKLYKEVNLFQFLNKNNALEPLKKEDIEKIISISEGVDSNIIKATDISTLELYQYTQKHKISEYFKWPQLHDFQDVKMEIIFDCLSHEDNSKEFLKQFGHTLSFEEVKILFENFPEQKRYLTETSLFNPNDEKIAKIILDNFPDDRFLGNYYSPSVNAKMHPELVLDFLKGKKLSGVPCHIDSILKPIELLREFNLFTKGLLANKCFKKHSEEIIECLKRDDIVFEKFYSYQNDENENAIKELLKNEKFLFKYIAESSFSRDNAPNKILVESYQNYLNKKTNQLKIKLNDLMAENFEEKIIKLKEIIDFECYENIEEFRFSYKLQEFQTGIINHLPKSNLNLKGFGEVFSKIVDYHVEKKFGYSLEKMYEEFNQSYPNVITLEMLNEQFKLIISGKYRDFFDEYFQKIDKSILGIENAQEIWAEGFKNVKKLNSQQYQEYLIKPWYFEHVYDSMKFIQNFYEIDQLKINAFQNNLKQLQIMADDENKKNQLVDLFHQLYDFMSTKFHEHYHFSSYDFEKSHNFNYINEFFHYRGDEVGNVFRKHHMFMQLLTDGKTYETYELKSPEMQEKTKQILQDYDHIAQFNTLKNQGFKTYKRNSDDQEEIPKILIDNPSSWMYVIKIADKPIVLDDFNLNIYHILFDKKDLDNPDVKELRWSQCLDKVKINQIQHHNIAELLIYHKEYREFFQYLESEISSNSLVKNSPFFTFYSQQIIHMLKIYDENLYPDILNYFQDKMKIFVKNHPEIFSSDGQTHIDFMKQWNGVVNKNPALKQFIENELNIKDNSNDKLLAEFKEKISIPYEDFSLLNDKNKNYFIKHILKNHAVEEIRNYSIDEHDKKIIKKSIETLDEEVTMNILRHDDKKNILLNYCFLNEKNSLFKKPIKLNIKKDENCLEVFNIMKEYNIDRYTNQRSQTLDNLKALNYQGLNKLKDMLLDEYIDVFAYRYIGEKNNKLDLDHYQRDNFLFDNDISLVEQNVLISRLIDRKLFETSDINCNEIHPLNLSFLSRYIKDKKIDFSRTSEMRDDIESSFSNDVNYFIYMIHFMRQVNDISYKMPEDIIKKHMQFLLPNHNVEDLKTEGRYFLGSVFFKEIVNEEKYLNGFKELMEKIYDESSILKKFVQQCIHYSYSSVYLNSPNEEKEAYFPMIENQQKFFSILIETEPRWFLSEHKINNQKKEERLNYFYDHLTEMNLEKIYDNFKGYDEKLDIKNIFNMIVDTALTQKNLSLLNKINLQIKNSFRGTQSIFSNLDEDYLKLFQMSLDKLIEQDLVYAEIEIIEGEVKSKRKKKV